MKILKTCSVFLLLTLFHVGKVGAVDKSNLVFLADTIKLEVENLTFVDFDKSLDIDAVRNFYQKVDKQNYQLIVKSLLTYKGKHSLSDWIYYQLVRKAAQHISPKETNYNRYTLYKWFFLSKSGYDARVAVIEDHLLFYVKTEENIYDIPAFEKDGSQFICLNYHDFGEIDFTKALLLPVEIKIDEAQNSFSYKIDAMPDVTPETPTKKNIEFNYRNKDYKFKIVLSPDIPILFKNYPITDFESYFNIPMSKETYNSLIPELKKAISKMSMEKGVDYLMEFTRNAFLYETDEEAYGKEKRLSPEMMLFSKYSDCDDRAAFFFYLVKEIYNRPMIVLLYPTHVTVAVNFEKPVGNPVYYKNNAYAVCDPTPQEKDMPVGIISPKLKNVPYTIAYEYNPK